MEAVNPTPSSGHELARRLSNLRAGLRSDLEISRHCFHGESAYVVRDPITARNHRFSQQDYQVLVAIDQNQTLGRTRRDLVRDGLLREGQRDDFYRFVLRLHANGLLTLPGMDSRAFYSRYRRRMALRNRGRVVEYAFKRIPLWKPDGLLNRTHHAIDWIFSRPAIVVWFVGLLLSSVILVAHWHDFVSRAAIVMDGRQWGAIAALLLGLKLVHELGHAYACKRFGGTVPEIGVFLVFLTPCAYVDTSSSWGFTNRWHRITVALGGMYFESWIAMLALGVWCCSEPGPWQLGSQLIILLSTITTIGFNANPLMRYDGYYVLSDLLSRPNLHQEARQAMLQRLKRILYGVETPTSRSPRWLIAFGLACTSYRLVVFTSLGILLAHAGTLGLVVGMILLSSIVGAPLRKWIGYLRTSEELQDRRVRAVTVSVAAALLAVILVAGIPLPETVQSSGILQRERELVVRAPVDGFVRPLGLVEGVRVETGTVLCQLEDDTLTETVERTEREETRLKTRWVSSLDKDAVTARRMRELFEQARNQNGEMSRRARGLTVRAESGGTVTDILAAKVPGKFVHRGDPLLRLVDGGWKVKTVVTAAQLADFPQILGATVKVRGATIGHATGTGRVERISAAGAMRIPFAALTRPAGGDIPVHADHRALQSYYELDISVIGVDGEPYQRGATASVELGRTYSTIARRLFRRFRRFFLEVQAGWNR